MTPILLKETFGLKLLFKYKKIMGLYKMSPFGLEGLDKAAAGSILECLHKEMLSTRIELLTFDDV